MPWTADAIPDQSGRIALVTGANSGLGLETARALAGRGATVLLACRSLAKAEKAREELLTAASLHRRPRSAAPSIWRIWPAWRPPPGPWPSATGAWIC